MRSRIPRLLAVTIALAFVAVACGSDSKAVNAVESNDTAASAGDGTDAPDSTTAASGDTPAGDTTPVTPSADGRIAPSLPTDVSGAADVRTVLAQLGFRSDWPLPDGLAAADIAGLKISQTTGSDGTTTQSQLAWREAATDDPAALSAQWYDTARAVFGVEAAAGQATVKGNDLEGFQNLGGLAEDPIGSLTVSVIRPTGDTTAPVIVEIELEVLTPGPADLHLGPALLAALPDLTGCVSQIVSAEYRTYNEPNDFVSDPAYTTIFDGNCPTRSTYDAAVAWSTTAGVQPFQGTDKVEVTDAPGPSGTLLHVYSNVADDGTTYIRTDTTAPITVG